MDINWKVLTATPTSAFVEYSMGTEVIHVTIPLVNHETLEEAVRAFLPARHFQHLARGLPVTPTGTAGKIELPD